MHVTITNVGTEPEALVVAPTNIAVVLHEHHAYDLRDDAATVAVIGDKPDARDVLERLLGALPKVARDVLQLVSGRKKHAVDAGTPEVVQMHIANHGANGVRVILGDGVTEQTVTPGTSLTLSAPGYMELRELGLVEQPPGQQEAP